MAKGKFEYWITPDGLLRLEAYARDGLTDEQIASNLGINRTTLYDWKNRFPDIDNSLKRGKEVVDVEVENALFKAAKGYTYDEITQELVYVKDEHGQFIFDIDDNGNRIPRQELRVTKIVKKEVQPSTTAQIFWLKNRKPGNWRDKQELEHTFGTKLEDFMGE